MSDERFDAPTSNGFSISRLAARARRIDRRLLTRLRREPRLLFEFQSGRDRFGFELHDLRESGFEVRLCKNTVPVIKHTFQTRKGAVRWAEDARHLIARCGENRGHR
jgi:hypothetical protein